MENTYPNNTLGFLRGGGEMGALIRNFDWSATDLGTPDTWPQSLRTTLSTVLSSKVPMFLWWGETQVQFFNDAFCNNRGDKSKHLKSLGQKADKQWFDNWELVRDMLNEIRTTGEAIWQENQLLFVQRDGKTQNAYFTYSYSPIWDENDSIAGVLAIVIETTETISSKMKITASEQHFQNLVRESPVGIIVLIGEEMHVQIVNEAYARLIGRTKNEVLGKQIFDIIPESEEHFRKYLDKVRTSGEALYLYGEPYSVNSQKEKIEGYLNIIYQPYREGNGNITGVMVLVQDATEDIKSRNKIRENEHQIRSLVESATFPIGVYIGKELIISLANQAILNVWGRDKSIIGQPYREALPELASQKIFEELERVFETGIPFHSNNRYVELNVNGKIQPYYMNYSFTPLLDTDGVVYGIMSSAANVTELNLANQKHEESELKFRSLIEQAPVATCLFVDKEMKIELANEIMIGYWGKDGSVIGKPLAIAVPELEGQPFLDILANVFNTGIEYTSRSARAELVVDGVLGTYYFDFTYKPLFDASGKVYGVTNMSVDVTERVLANQRIEETQRQLLSLFERSPVGIAIIAADNLTFTLANPFYGELVGRSPEDIINKPLLEALPELAGQGFDKLLENVIATGVPYIANEVKVELLRNGILENIYVDLAYQPQHSSEGIIDGIFVVATDVTQQVRSRLEVESSATKLRSLIASAPAGIGLFIGRDLIVEMPNQMFIDIVGKGPDIVGKPLREVMPELLSEGQPFLKILDDVFTTGVMYQSPGVQVKIVQHGVMTYNYYNITYSPLFDDNGNVYGILDIAIDVTDAVRARQQTEDAEISLRGAIEIAELATWAFHIKEKRFSYSPRFMEWLGFDEDTKSIDEAYNPLPDEFRESVPKAVADAIAVDGSGVYKNEHPIINRITGQIRIIQAHAQVFYDAFGEPEVLSGTANDVTHERKLQQQLEWQVAKRTKQLEEANSGLAEAINNLERSNAELAQFAYVASHDLQEPVRKISTFAKMLESSIGETNDRTKNYIERINSSADRMINLIRDILGYSQLSKENEKFVPVDLNEIVMDILSDYEVIIEQKNAKISYENLPTIDAISLQMVQLFGNLISNSLKYSKVNVAPEIFITARLLSETEIQELHFGGKAYYEIIFSDNGIGFDQDYAEQIFNIFQRLHGKLDYAGTGIGLAMCKKIAENHHGIISATAEHGKGAKFSVILPSKH